MPPLKFTIEIKGEKFLLVKIDEPQGGDFFYVLPFNPVMRSFFMIKNTHGQWALFNRHLLSRDVHILEEALADFISKMHVE